MDGLLDVMAVVTVVVDKKRNNRCVGGGWSGVAPLFVSLDHLGGGNVAIWFRSGGFLNA